MKYWNNQGKYQATFDQMSDELMPTYGQCDTLAGELVRAASRLYYDAFNNGFCNNTSGAVKFLRTYLVPEVFDAKAINEALDHIEPKTNTGGYSDVTAATGMYLDMVIDAVVEAIESAPRLIATANPCDMLDLDDEEARYCDDEDEDEYSYHRDVDYDYE